MDWLPRSLFRATMGVFVAACAFTTAGCGGTPPQWTSPDGHVAARPPATWKEGTPLNTEALAAWTGGAGHVGGVPQAGRIEVASTPFPGGSQATTDLCAGTTAFHAQAAPTDPGTEVVDLGTTEVKIGGFRGCISEQVWNPGELVATQSLLAVVVTDNEAYWVAGYLLMGLEAPDQEIADEQAFRVLFYEFTDSVSFP